MALYVVATPIGNLRDITLRALDILRSVDLILCEDTRVTKKLLETYQINTSVDSYHQHSKLKKTEYIIRLLREGSNIALVSDAGTPGISDPGNELINLVIERLGDVVVIPVPGASAVLSAASISGFPTDRMVFMGFPPHKKKRKKYFEEVLSSKYPVVFFESPHRIIKSLKELDAGARSRNLELKIVVCRELTKKFETIYRGAISKVIFAIESGEVKGEFVIITGKS